MGNKERLLMICRENETYLEELKGEGFKRENEYKTAKATTAIINALCSIDNLTPRIAENALKMAGEFIDHVAKNEVMN